jgi:hypothetical protein
MGTETQRLKIPAEELDKSLSDEKYYVCIILTNHGQVFIYQMNVFR